MIRWQGSQGQGRCLCDLLVGRPEEGLDRLGLRHFIGTHSLAIANLGKRNEHASHQVVVSLLCQHAQ